MRLILIVLCLSETVCFFLPIFRFAYPYQQPISIPMYTTLTAKVLLASVLLQLLGLSWKKLWSLNVVLLLLSLLAMVFAAALVPTAAEIIRLVLSGFPSHSKYLLMKSEELGLSKTIGSGVLYAIVHSVVIFTLSLWVAISAWTARNPQLYAISRQVRVRLNLWLVGVILVSGLCALLLPFAHLPVVGGVNLFNHDLLQSACVVFACILGIVGVVERRAILVLLGSIVISVVAGFLYYSTTVTLSGLGLVFENSEWGLIGSILSISVLTSGFGIGMLALITLTLVLLTTSAMLKAAEPSIIESISPEKEIPTNIVT